MTPTTRRASTALALCLAAGPALSETLLVTTFDATGDGSLQAALDAAAASPERSTILVTETGGTITTETGLTYSGTSALTIYGNGLTIASPANVTLFAAIGTEELHLDGLRLTGPGDFSITARGDLDGPAGKGIFLDVAEDAAGDIDLILSNVSVAGVAGHGIHVSDCTLADECGGGSGGGGEGSAASINVQLMNVRIQNVGNGRFDADGLRVDERGEGDISLVGLNVLVQGVGADGIELDEGQEGDVSVEMIDGRFIENGAYCDPALLASHMPGDPEGQFDEGTMAADAIPGPVVESPDDTCFERVVDLYDDGSVEEYEFAIDVDDGFDIDEAGPGSLFGTFTGGAMSGNFDEGYDFDEEGPGDIDVVFSGFVAMGNTDDAIKLSEADDGNVYAMFTAIEATANGGVGIVGEEDGPGDLQMVLIGIATAGNDGGDLGVEGVQEDAGEGLVYIIDSETADGIDTDGATLIAN